MKRLRVLAAVGCAALVASSCDASGDREREPDSAGAGARWRVHHDSAAGYRVSFPRDWHRATRSLTPSLLEPKEILSVGTRPLRRGPGCTQLPTHALADLGPGDALVSIQERAGRPTREFRARPAGLGLGRPTRTEISECVPGTRLEERFLPFRDGGRAFYAIVGFGPAVDAETRRTTQRILDSLEFFGPGRSRERGSP